MTIGLAVVVVTLATGGAAVVVVVFVVALAFGRGATVVVVVVMTLLFGGQHGLGGCGGIHQLVNGPSQAMSGSMGPAMG